MNDELIALMKNYEDKAGISLKLELFSDKSGNAIDCDYNKILFVFDAEAELYKNLKQV